MNIIERADLVFQNVSEIKQALPSLNTEECNALTFRMLWVLFFFLSCKIASRLFWNATWYKFSQECEEFCEVSCLQFVILHVSHL